MKPRTLLVAFALVAGACSSDDDPTSTLTDASDASAPVTGSAPAATDSINPIEPTPTAGPTTASTAATSSPAGTTEPPPDIARAADAPDLSDAQRAEQDLARSVLITLDSFPDGWIEEPNDDDDSGDDAEFESQFDACLGRDDDERVGDDLEPLAVSTGDFRPVDDESTSVSHEVVLAPDADTAITAMSEVSVEGAETCIADVVERFYETSFTDDPDLAGIDIGDVIVTRTERERPADVAIGVLLEIPLTLDGQTVSQFLEVLYQRQGRALSELSFTSLGSPFSRDGYTILSDEAAVGLATIGN